MLNRPAAGRLDPARTRLAPLGWAAGAVSGLGLIAIADLTAWMLIPEAPPLSLLAAAASGSLPTSSGAQAIADFATAHPLQVVLAGVAVVVLTAVAGALELRRRWSGIVVFAALAVAGVAATVYSFPGWFNSLLPMIFGPAVGYVVLRLLVLRIHRYRTTVADLDQIQSSTGPTRSPDHPVEPGTAPPRPPDLSHQMAVHRRHVVRTIGVVGAVTAAAAATGETLLAGARSAARIRADIRLPAPATPAAAPPVGSDLELTGLSPYVTPTEAFYRIDTALQVPQIGATDWELKVTGMVRTELTLSYEQLLARPLVEHYTTMTCKANPIGANAIAGNLVGTARWLGLPVRELLAEAGPLPGADMVLSTSQDGWSAGTPLEVLQDEDRACLLAVGMNGQPLPPEHGFPVRMVVPGLYGDVSATKWVVELKVTTFEEDEGYWTSRGWSPTGPVKLSSRIDVPTANTLLEPGPVTIAGVAYAPHVGIERVQVRVDDGAWREATLAPSTGPDTWCQWEVEWTATPGNHELTVRAIDTNGAMQVEQVHQPAPSGATGWQTVPVRIRKA